jgi:hypothetical protein
VAIRKNNGRAGHELYYDVARKEAYVVHEGNEDKTNMAKQHMAKFKALGERNEMSPSGNPDHSIMPQGNKVETIIY